MRRTLIAWVFAAVFCLTGLAFAVSGAGAANAGEHEQGLAAHYYRDHDFWDGLWPDSISRPLGSPENWTFMNYKYTRIEPLINHQFIRRGWFSVRWQGYLDTAPAGGRDQGAAYTFSMWADDGCRLFIDGQKLIDDWRACDENDAGATRTGTVALTPGKHKIVVEYFQGQSLQNDDRDPVKLYWECEARNIPHQILPASHLSHTAADLEPAAGRLD
jgi:hypothetical protein